MKKLRHDVATSESSVELSPSVKGKLVDEILERLKRLEEKSNVTLVRGLCFFVKSYIIKKIGSLFRLLSYISSESYDIYFKTATNLYLCELF